MAGSAPLLAIFPALARTTRSATWSGTATVGRTSSIGQRARCLAWMTTCRTAASGLRTRWTCLSACGLRPCWVRRQS